MDDFVEDFLKWAEVMSKAPTNDQMRESQELLDLATQDLKSSKLLYEGKIFNYAVYHLQQSVEKAVKAFYKLLGILDDKTIRQTGHNSPGPFVKMIELPFVKQFADYAKNLSGSDFVTDTSQVQSVLNEEEKRLEVAKLNSENINAMLSFISKLETELDPLLPIMNNDYIMATLRLYILSALTFPHEEFTRYSDKAMKPSEYTLDLGIVANIQNIWNEVETTLNEIQILIDLPNEKRYLNDGNSP